MSEVEVEQYSEQSRALLREAAAALVTVLQQHTAAVLAHRGGEEETEQLFDLNDAVREAALAWEDAVFDHTGTFPLALELFDEDEDSGELAPDGPAEPPAVDGAQPPRQ